MVGGVIVLSTDGDITQLGAVNRTQLQFRVNPEAPVSTPKAPAHQAGAFVFGFNLGTRGSKWGKRSFYLLNAINSSVLEEIRCRADCWRWRTTKRFYPKRKIYQCR